jgi:hypothetical protein
MTESGNAHGDDVVNLYRQVACHLPSNVGLGGALINITEPHLGYEVEYNRWYEDDHFTPERCTDRGSSPDGDG